MRGMKRPPAIMRAAKPGSKTDAVEVSPAPLGARYQPIGDRSVKNQTQEPLSGRLPAGRGGAATPDGDAKTRDKPRSAP